MSERRPSFRYRLDALIRLRAGERDALAVEMGRAAAEVERQTRESEDLARSVLFAERALRAMLRTGAEIAVDEQARLQAYLRERRRLHEAKQVELERASRAMFRALEALQASQRDTRALESDRERKRLRFEQAQSRLSQKDADDQWLRRQRGRR